MRLRKKKQPEVEGLSARAKGLDSACSGSKCNHFLWDLCRFLPVFSQILKDFAKGQMEGGGQPGVIKRRAKAEKLDKPDSYEKEQMYCVFTDVFQLLEVS